MHTSQFTAIRYVRSSTDANKFYTVALNPRGFWECDCPSAQYRRTVPCKHCKAVAKEGAGLAATPKRRTLTHAQPSSATRDLISALDVQR